MPRDRLDALLEQLGTALDEDEGRLEADERARLEALAEDIRERLERDRDAELVDDSLLGRLDHAVDAFEARHPDLTIQLKAVVDAFRALGFR